jgi:hypothetical protein
VTDLLRAHVPACIPPEMRQFADAVAKNCNILIDASTNNPANINVENADTVDGEHASDLHNAGNLTGAIPVAVFSNSNIYVEGTIGGTPLASGGTQVVDGRTISGKAVVSTHQVPAGAAFGAIWNGTNYTLFWCNPCPERV